MATGNFGLELVDEYFKEHPYAITQHQLDSFRELIRTYIPATIRANNPITMIKNRDGQIVRVDVFVGGADDNGESDITVYLDRPNIIDEAGNATLLTPNEARLRNLTYSSKLSADLTVKYTYISESGNIQDTAIRHFKRVPLGEIPIMLHSDACILRNNSKEALRAFGECPYDQGGYFVVDGKEKVIISQERIATNRLFTSSSKDPSFSHEGLIRCTSEDNLIPKTIKLFVIAEEVLGFKGERIGRDAHLKQIKKEWAAYQKGVLMGLPGFGESKIPLFVLFRALGIESDKEIVEMITSDQYEQEYLRPCITQAASWGIFTQKAALEKLSNYVYFKSVDQVRSIILDDVFPNMGTSFREKAIFLAYVTRQLLQVAMGVRKPIDRDNYMYKRVDLGGFLIAQLFQEAYKQFSRTSRDKLDREYYFGPSRNAERIEDILVREDNLARVFPVEMLRDTLVRSIKGMWGTGEDPEQGKVQDLARISFMGFQSHLRRVNTPLDRSIKLVAPHYLTPQQYGVMCPFESPDGASIGYLKNFAVTSFVTFGSDPVALKEFLSSDEMGVIPLQGYYGSHSGLTRVFINGNMYGLHAEPNVLVHRMRLMRRNGLVSPFLSVAWNIKDYEIRIQTDAGRTCRPLLVMSAPRPKKMKWFDMVFGTALSTEQRNRDHYYFSGIIRPEQVFSKGDGSSSVSNIWEKLEKTQGCIEFIDVEEADCSLIAMTPDKVTPLHTHCEIHPTTAYSVVTNNIPFANHNQAPRNIFFGAQGKQSVGVYASNFAERFDTMGYVLHYTQRPLVYNSISKHLGTNELPYGMNTIVAVMSHTGFNQEDAVIINRAAIDRGLFQTTVYKTLTAQEENINAGESVRFCNPQHMRDKMRVQIEGVNASRACYSNLDDSGVVLPETVVKPYDPYQVLVGMCHVSEDYVDEQDGLFTKRVKRVKRRDVSLRADQFHYGTVDRVYVAKKGDCKLAKVRLRKVRRPELGDKMASRSGQKGVVGMVLNEEDMPFAANGIIPDIIINPHAFPSRMTIGHVLECILAKLNTLDGTFGDGTMFIPVSVESIAQNLEEYGYDRYGNELLYNGRTGHQIHTEIFIGPTYYMRLKHMVADKINGRGKGGPRVQRTMQPTGGRSNEGGMRVGEMERDVMIAYGMSQFIKESMMERSDKYKYMVCRSCGTIARYPIAHCGRCGTRDNIVSVETPYAFKLLVQEIEAMGVQMRLLTDEGGKVEDITQAFFMSGGGDDDDIDGSFDPDSNYPYAPDPEEDDATQENLPESDSSDDSSDSDDDSNSDSESSSSSSSESSKSSKKSDTTESDADDVNDVEYASAVPEDDNVNTSDNEASDNEENNEELDKSENTQDNDTEDKDSSSANEEINDNQETESNESKVIVLSKSAMKIPSALDEQKEDIEGSETVGGSKKRFF